MRLGALGVYLHFPYCSSVCPYCAFNKYAASSASQALPSETIASAMAKQAVATFRSWSTVSRVEQQMTSVYWGGGTPSLCTPRDVGHVMQSIRSECDALQIACNLREVTLECNPLDARNVQFLHDLKTAGVSRLSLGIQSVDAHTLKLLGRDHSPQDAVLAVQNAVRVFGARGVSVDLIVGTCAVRSSATASSKRDRAALEDELEREASLVDQALKQIGTVGHVSVYELSIERGTPFFKKGLSPLEADHAASLFEACGGILRRHSFVQYEVGSWAHESEGACAVHNSTYWAPWIRSSSFQTLLNGDVPKPAAGESAPSTADGESVVWTSYLGVGPGAHGRLAFPSSSGPSRVSTVEIREPKRWASAVLAVPTDVLVEEYTSVLRTLVAGDAPTVSHVGAFARASGIDYEGSLAEYVGASIRTRRGVDLAVARAVYRHLNTVKSFTSSEVQELVALFQNEVSAGLIYPMDATLGTMRGTSQGLAVADALYTHVWDRVLGVCKSGCPTPGTT
eukprot:ANDGO_04439.mRNA.1 mitochondrial Radical S-adenosyl methionine domain-containing protein 1